jgi:hypothetical protein
MTRLAIVNPVAEPLASTQEAERFAPAPRPDSLDGKTIGLFWNGKPQGDIGLEHTRRNLERLYDGPRFVEVFGEKGGLTRFAGPGQLDLMVEQCDVVVGATAD